ncbi:hypothetical protein CRI94_07745 [Longibacter salinarum]|uniref:Glycosyl hydrolase family 13 catalytic domain-containing protein n=1 Tax=Longibacter salinarum TaxID=1850348 RepID=A0A2A8CYZ0_9BACT|nr:alpha-amylase family glycosyl hydrolase [Longibacter salinarum]PEN13939.1 hypothetical protein CRI94_07745 [Longibacter salinarum]
MSLSRFLAAACAALLFLPISAQAQAPTVDRVDPSNWWTGMVWNDVQLMVYGDHLDAVTARAPADGITVTAVHSVPNDDYAFIDVTLAEDLAPGRYDIIVSSPGGDDTIAFPVQERTVGPDGPDGFGPDDVVYLITPDRFANGNPSNDRVEGIRDEYDPSDPRMRHGGDLRGIIEHLDELEELGVTTLWLTPILENRGRNSYHGYAATDLYRVDPRFGTNDTYRELVAEAHEHGLKVIYDHVSNHIGIEHPWMENLPRESWVNGSVEDHHSDKHYKMSVADPHADPEQEELLRTFWFVDAMPDLNQEDPFVSTYLIQNMIWWIETTGLDGIREDTYPYADPEFLSEWAEALQAEYPNLSIVGEVWDTAPAYTAMYQSGSPLTTGVETHLPSVMDFALSTALRDYLQGDGGLSDVYQVLAQDLLYGDPMRVMTLIDNHDMPRAAYLADGDRKRLKQVLTMLFTLRGIPQMLYGTEIGMVGGQSHVELRADYPGGFPGDKRSAFTREGRTASENDIYDHIQSLLALRSEHEALRRGRLVQYPPTYGHPVYTYRRVGDNEEFLVIVNGGDEARRVDLEEELNHRTVPVRLVDAVTRQEASLSGQTPSRSIEVDARSANVYRVVSRKK